MAGDVKIIGASDYVKNLFLYAGYWGEFDFFPTEEDAIKSFENII
jgi:hypothetical protein